MYSKIISCATNTSPLQKINFLAATTDSITKSAHRYSPYHKYCKHSQRIATMSLTEYHLLRVLVGNIPHHNRGPKVPARQDLFGPNLKLRVALLAARR